MSTNNTTWTAVKYRFTGIKKEFSVIRTSSVISTKKLPQLTKEEIIAVFLKAKWEVLNVCII